MFADKKKGHAFFYTESYLTDINNRNSSVINCVHFLKFAVDAEGKLSFDQNY